MRHSWAGSHAWDVGLILAIVLGFVVRAAFVLPSDFPLNDGGLFLVMIGAVRSSAPSLPWSVSYNGLDIPFAYPPLGFLVAAALASLGVPALDVLRVLPLAVSTAAVGAFAFLARTTLPTRAGAVIATVLFAALPPGFIWQIMGGGLTRSFGFLFALLGLREAYLLVTEGGRRHIVLLGAFAALAGLSHLEMAWFLTLGTGCILLAFGRRWPSVGGVVAAAALAMALAAPWWVLMLQRYGPGPLLAASATGPLLGESIGQAGAVGEYGAMLVVLAVLAGSVAVLASAGPRFFLFGSLGVLFCLETRAFGWLSFTPLALALGGFVSSAQAGPAHMLDGMSPAHRARAVLTTGLALAGTGLLVLVLNRGIVDTGYPSLAVLSPGERAAMAWVAADTPASSRFVVLSGEIWSRDRSSEWFPVLARRVSLGTPQGAEWLPDREFGRRIDRHLRLQRCGSSDGDCLEAWARDHDLGFTHVYLVERSDCCDPLRAALDQDPRYRRVYSSPDAVVFERLGAAAPHA